ncbi:MAG TPA: hypothetical protein QGF02_04165 [Candidatus Babeliales bacterium]|nr:hypothetical protein [Candidatus Babeliales bacterium]
MKYFSIIFGLSLLYSFVGAKDKEPEVQFFTSRVGVLATIPEDRELEMGDVVDFTDSRGIVIDLEGR